MKRTEKEALWKTWACTLYLPVYVGIAKAIGYQERGQEVVI